MNPLVPAGAGAAVRPSSPSSRAVPKSTRRTPSSVRSTFPGLTSRWTIPASWTERSACARPAAIDRAWAAGMVPNRRTASLTETEGRNSVAIQGVSSSGAASMNGAP